MLNIFVLCHCGLGSGLLMKMTVDALLQERGLSTSDFLVTVYGSIDMPAAPEVDLIIATPEIAAELRSQPAMQNLRIIETTEYFNKKKLGAILFPVLDEIMKSK